MHFMRTALAVVPKGNADIVAAAIRTVFDQPDAAHVAEQHDVIAGMLGRQLPKVEAMMAEPNDDSLAFAAFPQLHWRQLWSTNRWNGEQGEHTAHRRRRGLAQPRGAAAPGGSRPHRGARLMGRLGRVRLRREAHGPCSPAQTTPMPQGRRARRNSLREVTTQGGVNQLTDCDPPTHAGHIVPSVCSDD